jgi:tRNA (mo5U34)-methyltransferase
MALNMPAITDEELGKYKWFHSIDLGDGVVTPGNVSPEVCAAKAGVVLDRLDLTGRSVLDIGAWNGYYSFAAKQHGAARVLATDSFCWANPKMRGRESFELARSALGLEIESEEVDAAHISSETVGEFDVVMYLGVFYHRRDAMESLPRLATSAKEVLVVETQMDLLEVNKPAVAYYPTTEMRGDASNWWGPNALFMKNFLLGLGFEVVEVSEHPTHKRRGFFHAYRSADMRKGPVREDFDFYAASRPKKPKSKDPAVAQVAEQEEAPATKSFWKRLTGG